MKNKLINCVISLFLLTVSCITIYPQPIVAEETSNQLHVLFHKNVNQSSDEVYEVVYDLSNTQNQLAGIDKDSGNIPVTASKYYSGVTGDTGVVDWQVSGENITIPNTFFQNEVDRDTVPIMWLVNPNIDNSETVLQMSGMLNPNNISELQSHIYENNGVKYLDLYAFWATNSFVNQYFKYAYTASITSNIKNDDYLAYKDPYFLEINAPIVNESDTQQKVTYAMSRYLSWTNGMNSITLYLDNRFVDKNGFKMIYFSDVVKINSGGGNAVNFTSANEEYPNDPRYTKISRNKLAGLQQLDNYYVITINLYPDMDRANYSSFSSFKEGIKIFVGDRASFPNGLNSQMTAESFSQIADSADPKLHAYAKVRSVGRTVLGLGSTTNDPKINVRYPASGNDGDIYTSTDFGPVLVNDHTITVNYLDQETKQKLKEPESFSAFSYQSFNLYQKQENSVNPDGIDVTSNQVITTDAGERYAFNKIEIDGTEYTDLSTIQSKLQGVGDENQSFQFLYRHLGNTVKLQYLNARTLEALQQEVEILNNQVDYNTAYDATDKKQEEIIKDGSTYRFESIEGSLQGQAGKDEQIIKLLYRKQYQNEKVTVQIPVEVKLQENGDKKSYTDGFFKVFVKDQSGKVLAQQPVDQSGEVTLNVDFNDIINENLIVYQGFEKPDEPGFTYDHSEQTVPIEIDEEENQLVIKSSIEKVIFENTYEKPNLSKLNANFTVSEIVNGKEREENEYTYQFEVSADETNDRTGYDDFSTLITSNETKEVVLPAIQFHKPGTYRFWITQMIPEQGNTLSGRSKREIGNEVTFDTRRFGVDVEVSNNDFHNVPEITNVSFTGEDNNEVDRIVFENLIGENIATQTAIAEVKVENTQQDQEVYTFRIERKQSTTDTNRAPLPDNTILRLHANETGSFDTISYNKVGTYKYTIQQITEDKTGYILDRSTIDYVVNVIDDHGILKTTTTYVQNGDSVDHAVFTNKKVNGLTVYYYQNNAENPEKIVFVANYDLNDLDTTDSNKNIGYVAGYQVDQDNTNHLRPLGIRYVVSGTDENETYSNGRQGRMNGEEYFYQDATFFGQRITNHGYFWSFTPVYDKTKFTDPLVRGYMKMDSKFLDYAKDYLQSDGNGNYTLRLYDQWDDDIELLQRTAATGTVDMFTEIYTKNVETVRGEVNPNYGNYEKTKYENKEQALPLDQSQTLNFYSTLDYDSKNPTTGALITRQKLSVLYTYMHKVIDWKGDMVALLDARLAFDKNIRLRFDSTWLEPDVDKLSDSTQGYIVTSTPLETDGVEKSWIFEVDRDKMLNNIETMANHDYYKVKIPTKINRENLKKITFDEFMKEMRLTVADSDNEAIGLNAYIDENKFNIIATSEEPVIRVKGYNDIQLIGRMPARLNSLMQDSPIFARAALSFIGVDTSTVRFDTENGTFTVPSKPIANTEYIRLYPTGRTTVEYVIDDDHDNISLRDDVALVGRSQNPNESDTGREDLNYTNTYALYDRLATTSDFDKTKDIITDDVDIDVLRNRKFIKDGVSYTFYGARLKNNVLNTESTEQSSTYNDIGVVHANDINGLKNLLQDKPFLYNLYNENGAVQEDRTLHYTFLYRPVGGSVDVKYVIENTDTEIHLPKIIIDSDSAVGLPYHSTDDDVRLKTISYNGNLYELVRHRRSSAEENGLSEEERKTVVYEYRLVPPTDIRNHNNEPQQVNVTHKVVKTGVNENYFVWITLLVGTILLYFMVFVKQYKKSTSIF